MKLRDLPALCLTALALAGCAGAASSAATPAATVDPEAPPPRTLRLGVPAQGNTETPDGRAMSTCKSGGRAGQALDHLYGFEVSETASYHFQLDPEFQGVFQVQQKIADRPGHFGLGCAAAPAGGKASLSLALEPGSYWVVVDGDLWDEDGAYRLRVDLDTSAKAMIRAEEPARVKELVAKAAVLRPGERALGVYRSTPGGARPACGLFGSDTVRRLVLERAARLRLRAAAQFVPALEVRGPSGAAAGCARAAGTAHEVELVVELPAGDSTLVLDATALRQRAWLDNEGAAVAGAYVIDVEEAP